jgi:hypothetical protein
MMENTEKYMFFDFTLINYNYLLTLALNNYQFCDFTTIKTRNGKSIILRHDVEYSIPIAERMANIEADLGIRATYFLQLHSVFYNPLDKDVYNSIKRIMELGHHLGLHFDSHFWGIEKERELEKYMLIDKETLEKYFECEIKVFSFHCTNDFILSCEKEQYAGMINVYSKYFKNQIGYNTDSTGIWRYERLEDRLKEAKDEKLQILIHDGMWQDEILPPRRRVFKVIDERAEYVKMFYDEMLIEFKANNVDW